MKKIEYIASVVFAILLCLFMFYGAYEFAQGLKKQIEEKNSIKQTLTDYEGVNK